MNEPQLPLFDWPTSIMGEGYRRMADFRFEEAEEFFDAVRHSGQGEEEEIEKALHACNYWQALIEKNKTNPGVHPLSKLYEEFCQYPFGNNSGLHQLKEALLEYFAERLISEDRFYIHENGTQNNTAADLLMKLRQYKKAEKITLHRIEERPDDIQLRYLLAQIQWLNSQKGEAKKSYAKALLSNPCRAPFHRILYQSLHSLIEDVGAEMAPAYGWVQGVLPLVPLDENLDACSELHQRALKCYRLLWSADRSLRNKNIDACVKYRKKLNAEDPELYEEYFALLNSRHE